jgi:L-alanine-DL-glutamate epimerase-like enolase superfamily enzyme
MSIDTTILSVDVEFLPRRFKTPLVLSSGPITKINEARVTLRVHTEGKEAVGRGSIYLSDLWAWPDPKYTHEQRDALLQDFCRDIAKRLNQLGEEKPLHPLELGLRLHNVICHGPDVPERFAEIPILARAMCLSPFDAAIHDAAGIGVQKSAFDFYDEPASIPSADDLFPSSSAVAAVRDLIRHPPRRDIPAWLIVGKNDDLQRDARPWVVDRGYRCFKLKIMGKDSAVDAARTVEVYRAAKSWGVADPWLSVDSNEANPDAASVLDYLQRLESADADAFAALKYLEQPTGRDIRQNRYDWHEVTRHKPVLLDEGLTSLSLLPEAIKQGWNGLALKTCKGHSFALVAAAWAKKHNMLLALQDLTNPGYSFIHSALFAAFVPTINGVELNSPQFTPDANREWSERLPELFEPQDGRHRLPEKIPVGLGSGI